MDDLPYTQVGEKVSVRLVERLLAACGWTDVPLDLTLREGGRIAFGGKPKVTVRLCRRSAILDLLRPDLERLGEAYVAGRIDFDGTADDAVRTAIELASRRAGRRARPWRARVSCAVATDSLRDLPTPFFERVLGPPLESSCARFLHADTTLAQAQFDGFEQVCRTLGLRPGMRVLDVGCGWGAFALHAAARFGVSVVGLAASPERGRHASALVARSRVGDRIDIRPPGSDGDSYPGERFDRVVSIDLLERAGPAHLVGVLARAEHALVPGGTALVRTVDVPALHTRGGGGIVPPGPRSRTPSGAASTRRPPAPGWRSSSSNGSATITRGRCGTGRPGSRRTCADSTRSRANAGRVTGAPVSPEPRSRSSSGGSTAISWS